jgi:hypothetical protein
MHVQTACPQQQLTVPLQTLQLMLRQQIRVGLLHNLAFVQQEVAPLTRSPLQLDLALAHQLSSPPVIRMRAATCNLHHEVQGDQAQVASLAPAL